jgi:ribosomal protein S18 acetylase RimI-like enzyme/NTP pyrophosphatase (non-canonical NTP hydrolase)
MTALYKLIDQMRKSRNFGFDWPDIFMIIDQAISECDEIREALHTHESLLRLQEEIGDLLHTAISLCVFAGVSVEETLTLIIKKFGTRLDSVYAITKERGLSNLRGQPVDQLMEIWHEAKTRAYGTSSDLREIRLMETKDIPHIVQSFAAANWPKPTSLFEKYLLGQGKRLVWVAFHQKSIAGYVTLKWESTYPSFRDQNIPEIKDLNVLPPFRNQGVGSKLLDQAEEAARKERPYVGLGVGLYKDYGAAQRLYVKRGYIPDGLGIAYHEQPVEFGNSVPADDDLVLWFTKRIRGSHELD